VLDQLSKHRTVVVVAHRLSTVMRAEQVIVLWAGCITEIGTPEELLRNNSIFARMYELQRMGTVESAAGPDI
jgi:ABC-type multidrug transport system fused ATPase/permease subunit